MPGRPRRARRAPIRHLTGFRLLAYRVEIEVDDVRVAHALRYLVTGAAQPRVATAAMHYCVRGHGPYVVLEEGDDLGTFGTLDDVLYVVYGRCYARLIDHMTLGGWVALHAGIVRIGDRRALVIGDKSAGKTTLLLRLLHDGHAVEGDEVVFTRDAVAIAQPRNFHVKPPTGDLVPELASCWASLPSTRTTDGLVIRAFDPAASGFAWSIRQGPVDAAFLLHPERRGTPACHAVGSVHGVAAAVASAMPTAVAPARVVQACAALLGRVPAHDVTVGSVDATAALVVGATAASPATSRGPGYDPGRSNGR